MTNPIAVLLIIGSAVVGPIEASSVKECPGPWRTNSMGQQFKNCAAVELITIPRETLPELCERAMREIGSLPLNDGTGRRAIGPDLVRCLPVPEGYKR